MSTCFIQAFHLALLHISFALQINLTTLSPTFFLWWHLSPPSNQPFSIPLCEVGVGMLQPTFLLPTGPQALPRTGAVGRLWMAPRGLFPVCIIQPPDPVSITQESSSFHQVNLCSSSPSTHRTSLTKCPQMSVTTRQHCTRLPLPSA
jgi:hypothetical protein